METNKNNPKTTRKTTAQQKPRPKTKGPIKRKQNTKTDTLKGQTAQIRTINAKKRMIEAMEMNMCIVSNAVKDAKISRSQHYQWMTDDLEYQKQINELSETVHDIVENELFKQIKGGNTTSTIFYMKCKMRGRGYIEKTEMDLNVNRPDLSEMSTDEIRKLLDSDDEQT